MNANDDLRARFVRDAKERMRMIRDAVGDVASDLGVDAVANGSVEIAREQAHMIKGAAGMLDFDEVKTAAASFESIAAKTIEGGGQLAGDAFSVALEQLGTAIDVIAP